MTAPRKLVPYDEARHLLGGISRSLLYDLLQEGRVERVKLGSRGFVTVKSIDQFIDGLPRG